MYPTTGYPMPPQPPVPTRKGPLLWVLVALAVILLGATGALNYLRFSENSSSQAEITAQDAQIKDLKKSANQIENANEDRRDNLRRLQRELDRNRATIEDLKNCPAKVQVYVDSAVRGDNTDLQRIVNELVAACHLDG